MSEEKPCKTGASEAEGGKKFEQGFSETDCPFRETCGHIEDAVSEAVSEALEEADRKSTIRWSISQAIVLVVLIGVLFVVGAWKV